MYYKFIEPKSDAKAAYNEAAKKAAGERMKEAGKKAARVRKEKSLA